MIRFITFLALVVGGIGVIKPAAGLAGLRVDLRSVGVDAFQRRQTTVQVPPQCETLCNPINAIASTVSDIICTATNSCSNFRIAHPLNVAWPLSRPDISIVSCASAMQQM